ncbi:MAG TPA: NTF2 fold immunity protein [Tepidisphaeraceae bacterium]|jgi:hypothetical protein|nr:NTF2 fold immunity protein [Tepidisphaeraceae bacterium]
MADHESTSTDKSPEAVLARFIEEMNRWEVAAWRRHRADRDPQKRIQAMIWTDEQKREVIERFCTPKQRKYGTASLSSPPRYDPAIERVINVEHVGNGKAFVFTTSSAAVFAFDRRYALFRKGDCWLIDNFYWRATPNEQWTRGIL